MSKEEENKQNEEKQKEIKRASIQFTDDILKISKEEVKNKENVDVTTSIPIEEKIKKAESIIVDDKNNNNENNNENNENKNENKNENEIIEYKIFEKDEYNFIKEKPLAISTFYDIKLNINKIFKDYKNENKNKENIKKDLEEIINKYDLEITMHNEILDFYINKYLKLFKIKEEIKENNNE